MSEDQNLILVQGLIENFDAKTTRTVVTICNNRLDSLGEPIAPPQRAKGVRSHGGYKPKDFNAKGQDSGPPQKKTNNVEKEKVEAKKDKK